MNTLKNVKLASLGSSMITSSKLDNAHASSKSEKTAGSTGLLAGNLDVMYRILTGVADCSLLRLALSQNEDQC